MFVRLLIARFNSRRGQIFHRVKSVTADKYETITQIENFDEILIMYTNHLQV